MIGDIGILAAFIAGILSFLTPCVVPVLPGYLAVLGGISAQELKDKDRKIAKSLIRVSLSTLAFTLGVAVIFTILGVTVTVLSTTVFTNRVLLQRIGGVIIILLGVYLLGLLKIPVLARGWQLHLPARLQSIPLISPFLIGLIFALAWTPCFGPILGAILTLAASTSTAWQGGLFLFVYALGLGAALWVFGILFVLGIRKLKISEQVFYAIKIFIGLLLIVLGVLIIFGWLNNL